MDDAHDHHDRGHVNFIVDGIPVLIESGTPGYANPQKRSHYNSAFGHNVLRIGDNTFPPKEPAPIEVHFADPSGGYLTVDLNLPYPELGSYMRSVEWTPRELAVHDTLSSDTPVQPILRWNLASQESPKIQENADKTEITVIVPAGSITYPGWIGAWNRDEPRPEEPDILNTMEMILTISSNQPIKVDTTLHFDHTLKFRQAENLHTTLDVSTLDAVTNWSIKTMISASPLTDESQ